MMRLLSLCAGIGAIDYVWSYWLGQTIAGQVELDPFCRAVLAKHWPDVPRLNDIREVRGDEFGPVDLVAGGIPCFVAGTLILTERGYRPIESLSIGDRVLTHLGRWQPITAIMKRDNAELRQVKAQGIPEIITTNEHPFFARKQTRVNSRLKGVPFHKRRFGEPAWTSAEHLNKDYYIAQVLPDVRPSEYQPAFWWLVGRYLADGWTTTRASRSKGSQQERLPYGVVICCSHTEVVLLRKKIQDAGYHASEVEERTVTKFHIANTELHRFLTEFGKYAHGKLLPGSILSLDTENAKALLEGYISGDGSRDTINNTWSMTTTSKALALSVALLTQRAYGIIASVRKCQMKEQTCIEGRTVQQRDFYVVTVPDRNRSGFIDGNYGWKLVRASKPCGIGSVYNISVAEDESYIADGAAVHNCQPFSHAGKRHGTADDRYLWPQAFRIVQRCQPSWVLIENVVGFISLALDQVQTDLASANYESRTFVLPACAIGAPHQRNRVFLVAHTRRSRQRERTYQSQCERECTRTPDTGDDGTQRIMADPQSTECPDAGDTWSRWHGLTISGSDVADAASQRLPLRRRTGFTTSDPQAATGMDTQLERCRQDVAHASSTRWQTSRPWQPSGSPFQCREDVAHASHDRPQIRNGRTTPLRTCATAQPTDPGQSQSRLGGELDGLADWLDGTFWPAGPGETPFAWEPPRTTKERDAYRRQRIKALGNAIVPQQVYPLLWAIVAVEQQKNN